MAHATARRGLSTRPSPKSTRGSVSPAKAVGPTKPGVGAGTLAGAGTRSITVRKRSRPNDLVEAGSSKYYNQFLFDYSKEETRKCMRRLSDQARIYESHSDLDQWRMRIRGLYVAALTLNATAIWTAKLLKRGKVSMVTQVLFFRKRWRQNPNDWGANAKSCFARALSGHSIGKDSVCIDRHLERMGLVPKNASEQWRHWFRLYESMYGPGETILCVRWHIGLLDWIAMLSERPDPWK
jgi:hypothetical protein